MKVPGWAPFVGGNCFVQREGFREGSKQELDVRKTNLNVDKVKLELCLSPFKSM